MWGRMRWNRNFDLVITEKDGDLLVHANGESDLELTG